MLTEIKLNGFASFKHETCLQTDKPVNFIYGLNGTGKSSLTRYLDNPANPKYAQCSMTPDLDLAKEEILVYNQDYINKVFYEQDQLKGIFTLSKENKKAYEAIAKANKNLKTLQDQEEKLIAEQQKADATVEQAKTVARETIWALKTKYSGGDRVLDYCLEGYKGSKANLFNKVKDTPIVPKENLRSIEDLKRDLIQLTAMEGKSYPLLPLLPAPAITEEDLQIVQKIIVGNEHSTISAVMEQFSNATWVRSGMKYIEGDKKLCPFCHQDTITPEFISNLQSYFDESYEKDIDALRQLEQKLSAILARLAPVTGFDDTSIVTPLKDKYMVAFGNLKAAFEKNHNSVLQKLEQPNIKIDLLDCVEETQSVNAVIDEANTIITSFNARVAKLSDEKDTIKEEFWKYQRNEYDGTIAVYLEAEKAYNKTSDSIKAEKERNEKAQKEQRAIIAANQKDVVNIDEAIANINANLISIGITDITIIKHEDGYRIAREGAAEDGIFRSLSEGEKMLISFLYFIEACKGRAAADEQEKKKIVVIDDPISSLS